MLKKVLLRTFLALLTILIIFSAYHFEALKYGYHQAKGQIKVMTNTIPIKELIADPDYPDSLKSKILLIQEIKQFTVDSLGLKKSGSYEQLYDQKGEPLIWMMTAAGPYDLKPYEWHFPVLGSFPYKGHFEKWRAVNELEALKAKGYDTRLGQVSAWSTLGYLDDPILSSFFEYSEGNLAALIIHELTHGTLYVKNDIEFNENLADFIGDQGARLFLKSKYGINSEEYKSYLSGLENQDKFSSYINQSCKRLDSLYQTFRPEMSSIYKDSLKYNLIDEIMYGSSPWSGNKKYAGRGSLNNAWFTLYQTYQKRQNFFENELMTKFDGNFLAYLSYLKTNYKSLGI